MSNVTKLRDTKLCADIYDSIIDEDLELNIYEECENYFQDIHDSINKRVMRSR